MGEGIESPQALLEKNRNGACGVSYGSFFALKTNSLSFRLLLSSGLVLAVFFALAAVVLERGFQESAEQALKEKLQLQIYSLLAAAEINPAGTLEMSQVLPEPRFSSPGSGLYAFIRQADQQLVWRSPSTIGIDELPPQPTTPGAFVYAQHNSGLLVLYYTVIWEYAGGREKQFTLIAAEDAQFIESQVAAFKKVLRGGLLVIGVLCLLLQIFVLRWTLKPLRDIGKDVIAIEQGKKTRLAGSYSTELQNLANNLNALIRNERTHLERYRNTLSDLAHSLKTPLAIIQGCQQSQELPDNVSETLQTQISRMNEIVEYQLQRAAAKGRKKLFSVVDVAQIVKKIIASLDKVHAQKHIAISFTSNEDCSIYCEEGDVYEIAGNLIENSYKWCRRQIHISISVVGTEDYSLCLQIEDDGPGIPQNKLQIILERGARADQNMYGYGIGMAIVNELLCLLGGTLESGRSRLLGGMLWRVYFP